MCVLKGKERTERNSHSWEDPGLPGHEEPHVPFSRQPRLFWSPFFPRNSTLTLRNCHQNKAISMKHISTVKTFNENIPIPF